MLSVFLNNPRLLTLTQMSISLMSWTRVRPGSWGDDRAFVRCQNTKHAKLTQSALHRSHTQTTADLILKNQTRILQPVRCINVNEDANS